MAMSTQERQLCEYLRDLPAAFKYHYDVAASRQLIYNLFWSLAGGQDDHMRLFFPEGLRPSQSSTLKLREAQGASDGAEYTEAARGRACGHIFKSGEASYRCKTCSADDTCVLCSRCYDSSDHTGHMVVISISVGNSGCCDCGDPEAWRSPVHCSIHSANETKDKKAGKAKEVASLPEDLIESIKMTIGRAFDYICDVVSCSPEQLRLPKTLEGIKLDEKMSRLNSSYYSGDVTGEPTEYALLLWNDEKHTVTEVRDQVARACKVPLDEALRRAHETDDIGRSIVKYDTDIENLLHVSKVIEQIKVTVTIRSARDTFREQMCGTIVEWLGDIAGCSVGADHNILRHIVCEEMLKSWRTGSEASNAVIGKNGIDDHAIEEDRRRILISQQNDFIRAVAAQEIPSDGNSDDEDALDGDGDSDADLDFQSVDAMIVDVLQTETDGDLEMLDENTALEEQEATFAGYPPPPPPPPAPQRSQRDRDMTPSDSDTAEPLIPASVYAKANLEIPKTPKNSLATALAPKRPPQYWRDKPEAFNDRDSIPLHEDLWQRVRLDWMILFDLRLWKRVRIDLRDLYISTVVTIPQFKRVLGLRFAGLYTTLAQLYLIADREPDHSIINISLQMLTTPSITFEIVERGNFLTNLMAILYTFLTTRQVGHPGEISPNATLAFDAGSITNRRMYHFFMDLKYLFSSEFVQERLRTEERYVMQFLDLVKLHQGICPNVRAIGDHVEYETDAWISASLITREINRLCRQFAESFRWRQGDDLLHVSKAIRLAAKITILNSLGTERKRFNQAEIKDEVVFKSVGDFEFDNVDASKHSVVNFVVDKQPISFHHALHYTLSWLIECGRSMPREQVTQLLTFTTHDLTSGLRPMGQRVMPRKDLSSEDYLMVVFDYPLRVCAWLAQMKAGMWVRNGMSLRHQSGTYRGVSQRDVAHQRDIFLLQTAMVVCNPSRVLATIIDRYGVEMWMKGLYEHKSDVLEDTQHLDVAEDLIHLLIVLLSDRTSLISPEDEPNPHLIAMRRDITHVLCFKPLSFSDIFGKLPDKFQDHEECQDILDEMTTFKNVEGLTDVGTFELKVKYLEDIDPYIAHYNKNQREESENAYKSAMSKKIGRPVTEIVYEPKLMPIKHGLFVDIAGFTRTGVFAQIIYYSLLYPLKAKEYTPSVPSTRVETFLQVVLHLILIAVVEDDTEEDDLSEKSTQSFVNIALNRSARSNFTRHAPSAKTIVAILEMMSTNDVFKACRPKIDLVLKRMRQKRPHGFEMAFTKLGLPVDRIQTVSPANNDPTADREQKKKAALDRQAKVMAQFQQQQRKFLDNQGDIDWGEDELSDEDADQSTEEQRNHWKFPSGTCILCQEETNDSRTYGTFAMFTGSHILRKTDFTSPELVREVVKSPVSYDISAEDIRPFGMAGENRQEVPKVDTSGNTFLSERQTIGKGFPKGHAFVGAHSVGCGHIMHYKCFELYYEASQRRHQHQIARHHPENLDRNEFVCPLCKALGNAFLPIIWRGKEEIYPGALLPNISFDSWLDSSIGARLKRTEKSIELGAAGSAARNRYTELFQTYGRTNLTANLVTKLPQLIMDAWSRNDSDASLISRPVVLHSGMDIPPPSPLHTDTALMREIIMVYRRLDDTFKRNALPKRQDYVFGDIGLDELGNTDILASALGFSISAVEIQQRGVANESGSTLINNVSQQSLAHLRILSETASSYVSIGGLRSSCGNKTAREFSKDYELQLFQLFIGHPQIFDVNSPETIRQMESIKSPLLGSDMFIFMTKSAVCLSGVAEIPIMHLLRLCYLAEMVKVILSVARTMPAAKWMAMTSFFDPSTSSDTNTAVTSFRAFCTTVTELDVSSMQRVLLNPLNNNNTVTSTDDFNIEHESVNDIESLRSFARKYITVFLRKCAILLHVRYGVDFSSRIATDLEADELNRLTELMQLPSFDELSRSMATPSQTMSSPLSASSTSVGLMQSIVYGWLLHSQLYVSPTSSSQDSSTKDLPLAHPAIFELIGLPKNYDTLIEETMKRKCPTTGKDISDPMLCLFCGDIFCGQANCCARREVIINGHSRRGADLGGAQRHLLNCRCQGNVGLYINVRKCTVYYLYHTSGSWLVAPYIDRYGEVDPGLRHGRQLFLNQKRYDALLRAAWLGHGIPSVISRKLEADINNGGWETI